MYRKGVVFVFLILIFCIIVTGCAEKEQPSIIIDAENQEEGQEVINIEEESGFKGDFLEEYQDINVSDIRKFLGTAVVKVRPIEYQTFDIPIISSQSEKSAIIMKLLHLNSNWFDEFVVSASLNNTRSYSVIIGKVKPLYEDSVLEAIDNRIKDLKPLSNLYPDQYYNVEHYFLGSFYNEYSDYLVFIISDNALQVFEELNTALLKKDLTDIHSVPLMDENTREILEKNLLDEEKEKIENSLNEKS